MCVYFTAKNMKLFRSYRWIPMAFVLACLTFFGSLLIQCPSSVNAVQKPEQVILNTTNTIALIWYWPFGMSYNLGANICHDLFEIPNCILVEDRSRFSEADFVIFHHRELSNGQQKLPVHLIRPQRQRWVWFSQECPENNLNMKPLAGHFNFTMSYRLDADITAPSGRLVPQNFGTGLTVEEFIPKDKSSLACWVVSNFSPHHKRTAVYNKLKTIIPVDVYGGAVNKRLDDKTLLPTISRCYFYLAFENSISRDYITEKFWYNALVGGAVPVVLGPPREQYEAVAPKDSFIHVDDFRSIEELGEFLRKLAEDKQRYASYFNWRLKYTAKRFGDWKEEFCRICPKVSSLQKQKVYNDLDAWERK